VDAKIRDKSRNVLEFVTLLRQSQYEFIVHRAVKVEIDPIAFVKDAAAEETAGCRHIKQVEVRQDKLAEPNLAPNAQNATLLVNPRVVAVYDVGL